MDARSKGGTGFDINDNIVRQGMIFSIRRFENNRVGYPHWFFKGWLQKGIAELICIDEFLLLHKTLYRRFNLAVFNRSARVLNPAFQFERC